MKPLQAKFASYSRFVRPSQWGTSFVFKQDALKKVFDRTKIRNIVILVIALTLPASFIQKEKDIIEYKSNISSPQGFSADKNYKFDTPSKDNNDAKSKNGKNKEIGKTTPIILGPEVVRPKDSILIPVGTSTTAELLTGGSNGPVKAKLNQSIVVQGETLVEEGAILFGDGNSGDERLFIKFSKIINFDGSIINIAAHACDPADLIVGVKGAKVGQRALQMAGGIGLGFLGGLSEGLETSQNVGGVEVHDNSLRNAMLNGAAHASIDESKDLMDTIRQKKTVIEVPVNTQVTVLFDELDHAREK